MTTGSARDVPSLYGSGIECGLPTGKVVAFLNEGRAKALSLCRENLQFCGKRPLPPPPAPSIAAVPHATIFQKTMKGA